MEALRLPRTLSEEPRAAHLPKELAARAKLLWTGGELLVPHAEVGPALEAALESARSAGQIVRGLEAAERALAAEERGLANVDRKTGVTRGGRVSRLLLLADDGAERFYRNVESLVRRHTPRVLALRLNVNEETLGELLFGREQRTRLVLVEHKNAVSAVLLALAKGWSR